jgi:hydroxyacylglutathione hydrolase
MIGLDHVGGILGTETLAVWKAAGGRLATVAKSTTSEVASTLERGEATVIDVRGRAEWAAAHLPAAVNIPLGELSQRLGEVPSDTPVILQCRSGARSAIGASVLQALGRTNVRDLVGGIEEWQRAGLTVVNGEAGASGAA